MKHLLLTISILLTIIAAGNCQNNDVIIEGQIIGYDGYSVVYYSLSRTNYPTSYVPLKMDSNGKFLIKIPITKTKFFFEILPASSFISSIL